MLFTDVNYYASLDSTYHESLQAAIFDWTRLGVFTGSRLSEYGQSKPRKGELFAMVPNSQHTGPWANLPLAFIADDFSLYDEHLVFIRQEDALLAAHCVEYTHVRFRFDKGPENFVTKKFKRVRGQFLCPVKAVLSILRRAARLGIPPNFPLGAFRPRGAASLQFDLLNGKHVADIMRAACLKAYPNPDHYMRRHAHLLMSHSNRVTAAVALSNAGVPLEVIAARLRWNVDSVKFYLRDCFRAIGPLTEKAIQGALLS